MPEIVQAETVALVELLTYRPPPTPAASLLRILDVDSVSSDAAVQ